MSQDPHPPVWRRFAPTPAGAARQRARVVVVGAGPVGLAVALDLSRRGHAVTILNRREAIAAGSRAICFSQRSLETFDRLGLGELTARGVTWSRGQVFWGAQERPVYAFDLQPVRDQKQPAFVNLQQYRVEDALIAALDDYPDTQLRWGHAVTGVTPLEEGVSLEVQARDAGYVIDADWVIACDGARSSVRQALGLDFEGRVFEDNFLIADIRMAQDRPAERTFWFDPPFNPGQSALMHKQPDNIWRLDFQLGWNIDREAAVRPENVDPLVRALLGPEAVYEPEWYSVYTFQCRRMSRFVHDRTIFAGDSAHLVSPFGARGCNGGLADAVNLTWKLDRVLRGLSPAALLGSYDEEAVFAADENILQSSRSTDFMTPKSATDRALRDAVLELAQDLPFARGFVNSGRLAAPVAYPQSAMSTPDEDDWHTGPAPGTAAPDGPLDEGWLSERLGPGFSVLAAGWDHGPRPDLTLVDIAAPVATSALARRYDLTPGAAYLLRPDGYVAARWRAPSPARLETALARACGSLQCP